jgi:hypothetical protein
MLEVLGEGFGEDLSYKKVLPDYSSFGTKGNVLWQEAAMIPVQN